MRDFFAQLLGTVVGATIIVGVYWFFKWWFNGGGFGSDGDSTYYK